MPKTQITADSITDLAVTEGKIANCAVAEAKIAGNAVTSAKITDGTVAAADLASSLDLTGKTVTLPQSAFATVDQNIALLGFKMAVNDGLTVFNLVDGVVDEFHDESGTDEGEGSNDTYCSSNDNYVNLTAGTPYSAGFGRTPSAAPISEPTTSEASEGPFSQGAGAPSSVFTVPSGITSLNIQAWGAGGTAGPGGSGNDGGGGGYAEGTLAVTATQSVYAFAGEGGVKFATSKSGGARGGGGSNSCHPSGDSANLGGGGGATFISSATSPGVSSAPQLYVVAGSGGGGGMELGPGIPGGGGGGLVGGQASTSPGTGVNFAQAGQIYSGGGGGQTSGGQGGTHATIYSGQNGSFLGGGKGAESPQGTAGAGGGSGFYGGGGGGGAVTAPTQQRGHGGGGSSYYGHPQITSGSTVAVPGAQCGPGGVGGGVTQPGYSNCTNEGGARPTNQGQDGFILMTAATADVTTSTTIVSNAFTAGSAPSTSRIVVFQENVATPTLNTDIIASISRDGGSNFTNVTLSDSGYVTGSSGQRILTGTATISGQPSGTSMRWKLALANNAVKIHGVSLQWK